MNPHALPALLLSLTLALTACSGSDDAGEPEVALPTTAVPTADPVTIGEVEWSSDESSLRQARLGYASTTSLLVVGVRGADEVAQVIDRATGNVRWERTEADERELEGAGFMIPSISGVALGPAADDPVLVPFRRLDDGRYSAGVVALDQATGREVWRRDLVGPRRASYLGVAAVLGFDDGVVVVATNNLAPQSYATHGVDLRTGEVLWTVRGPSAVAVRDGYVILDDRRRPTLVDVSTGDVVWRSAEPGDLKAVIEGAVVFAEQAAGESTVTGGTLVWLGSGRTAATGEHYYPAARGNDLLVWETAVEGHRLLHTLAPGETEPVVAELAADLSDTRFPTLSARGYVFYENAEGVTYIVGRDGRVVDSFEAPLFDVGDDYLLVGVSPLSLDRVRVLGLS